jgi:hypothetical protein
VGFFGFHAAYLVFSQQGIEDRKLFFFLDMSEGEEGMGEELKDAVQPAQLAIEDHDDFLSREYFSKQYSTSHWADLPTARR